ncbi:MAG: cytochrome P450 [Mycobacterium sp.]|uniref:cytochrome P450 n=1 Tax=Mycobacterium sp. TaxID=1785 RepID=UPI001EB39E41|nr:cytochrome P450 [Mycobacterium sp.]MBW0018059.1 cytochrome P450 [Mycobacterium sp.]
MSDRQPVMAFDTADRTFVAHPWEVYEQIRAAGGVMFNPTVNRWMVTGYQSVRELLTHPEQFGSERGLVEQAALFGGPTMEFYDSPHHDGIRSIWSHDFRPRALESWRPLITEMVRKQVDPAAERLRQGGRVELVSEVTRAIPTLVIARMIGVDDAMVDRFSAWSDAIGASAQGYTSPGEHGQALIANGKAATAELNDYLRTQLSAKRCPSQGGHDGLLAAMLQHEYACSHMTEQEIVANNTQLVFAGNETTAKLMAQCLVTLAQHPDQRHAIAADPNLVAAAVEEVHRHETISHSIFRDAVGEQNIGGHTIPDGDRVTLLLGAANRDPHRWERPADFDIHRKRLPHIGFAFGMHSCLGMNLARLEAQIFLSEWISAISDWSIEGSVDYGTNYAVRGPMRVVVRSDS